MDKLKMQTENLADRNFEVLSKMFPNAVTETIRENGEVVRAIDADVLRLFMVIKSPDTQMTFDLEKAKDQSKDNPVYYMQYAYARACSVLKKYNTLFTGSLDTLLQKKYLLPSLEKWS